MVFVQKWPFFHLLVLGYTCQEKVFCDILKRKNAFLGYKTTSLKRRKIEHFPKGLTRGFGRKLAIFPSFVFRQYRLGKSFLR